MIAVTVLVVVTAAMVDLAAPAATAVSVVMAVVIAVVAAVAAAVIAVVGALTLPVAVIRSKLSLGQATLHRTAWRSQPHVPPGSLPTPLASWVHAPASSPKRTR